MSASDIPHNPLAMPFPTIRTEYPPYIIQICPFEGHNSFDQEKKGIVALFSDGSLKYLYMDKEVSKHQTTWKWVWNDLPLPRQ